MTLFYKACISQRVHRVDRSTGIVSLRMACRSHRSEGGLSAAATLLLNRWGRYRSPPYKDRKQGGIRFFVCIGVTHAAAMKKRCLVAQQYGRLC